MIKPLKENEIQPAIVIPAYRRPKALHRLLQSVASSHYPNSTVQLIISLDNGAAMDVINIAESFQFSSGDVTVIKQEQPLGLRNHILWCGDLTAEYGSVIVLEEDLMVDPWFYHYATQALNFYSDEERVGGIALYSPEFNEFADLPFEPLQSDKDTFFMQAGCSSGQAWTGKQWKTFKKWYHQADSGRIRDDIRLPDWVRFLWKESSWKKYYSGWLADSGLYMVYPYDSYTTNCSDQGGAHLSRATALHQVKFRHPGRKRLNFQFSRLDEHAVQYDSFMEMSGEMANSIMNSDHTDLEIDLYGTKSMELLQQKEWVVTSRTVVKAETTFPLAFRPLELNLGKPGDPASALFFSLAKSSDIQPQRRLPAKKYFALAQYFMRFTPFKSRFFKGVFKGYVREVFRFLSSSK